MGGVMGGVLRDLLGSDDPWAQSRRDGVTVAAMLVIAVVAALAGIGEALAAVRGILGG